MNIIIITIASIIICPIGSYILAKYCKKKGTSNTLIKTAAFYSVAILTFSYLEITTIYQSIDWILGFGVFFFLMSLIWLISFSKNVYLKVPAKSIAVIICTACAISCTIGLLGTMFIVGEYEIQTEYRFGDKYIYRYLTHGNAISDYRSSEAIIFKRLPYAPFLEKKLLSKTYDDLNIIYNKIEVNYDQDSRTLNLSTTYDNDGSKEHRNDDIYLGN